MRSKSAKRIQSKTSEVVRKKVKKLSFTFLDREWAEWKEKNGWKPIMIDDELCYVKNVDEELVNFEQLYEQFRNREQKT